MDMINIKMLVAVEQLIEDPESVFDIVEEQGKAVILKKNKPAYVLVKFEEPDVSESEKRVINATYKLHEAMQIVLNEQPERIMHAPVLADEIFNRGLYRKKDGTQAMANQIRARSEKYSDLFEALSNNMIKLR